MEGREKSPGVVVRGSQIQMAEDNNFSGVSAFAKRNDKILILLINIAVAACVIFAFYVSYVIHKEIVYTHFFYIPIMLAGLWYYRKAVYMAMFLGAVHVLMTYYFIGFDDSIKILECLQRATIFFVVAYVIGFISEKRVKAEDGLATANKRLRMVSQAKSEFLANMSHELRTPLNSIIGFSEVLLEKTFGDLNEKQMRYASNIHTSGKHLLELINDILDLSKIEARKIELKYEKIPLKETLSECQTLVKSMASKKNISLEFEVEELPFNISVDPVRFKQIMYNLLSNAIKFTPDGGIVNVDAKPVNGMLQISVKDTGVGIAKKHHEKIFEEFYQVDSSYSKKYEGTGLGLPLTKKLVELHGGKIWMESELEKGSTFSFTIPQRLEEGISEAPAVEAIPAPVKEEGKPTILVVEDEKQASELLTIYLEEAGYQVICAFDGMEAIEKAKELKPSLITLDVILPKKGGFEVLQELKSLPETKDIPVIIISIVQNEELGLSLGAAAYLIKPIDKKELIHTLGDFSFTTKVKEKPVNILVVDDNPKDVELLTSILEPEGFGIIKAYGGKEGIELAIERYPDAIILDLLMPDVSGFEVVHRLKGDPRAKDIPIFLYTIKDLSEEEKKSLNDHVISIMQKGKYSKEDLLQDIKKVGRLS